MAYNYDITHNSGNYTPEASATAVFGMPRVIEGITLHWWGDPSANPSFEGVRDYLCRAGGNTSAHVVVTGTGRRAACIVNYNDVAWHSGSAWGNARTIGIELDPRCRPEDIDTVAEVIADIRSAFGDVPLYWHSYFIQTTCPGVYRDLVDAIDQLSYTKQSNAEWGQVTDKTPKTPQAPVTPPSTPTTEEKPLLYRVFTADNKQMGAYSVEANAYRAFVDNGKVGKILYGTKNVTNDLVTKYSTPSSTTTDQNGNTLPDSGKPVTEKDDYSEKTYDLVSKIWEAVQQILTKIMAVFK